MLYLPSLVDARRRPATGPVGVALGFVYSERGGVSATMATTTQVIKGQTVTVRFTGWGRLGEALAEVDGKPLFTFGGIAGEEAVVEITGVHRRYLVGRVSQVLAPSPHRVSAPCAYAGPCTGCQWQHIDYGHQLELKRLAVEDALSRVGGLEGVAVNETLPSPSPWGYRNHARFTVDRRGRLGYVNRESRAFVEVDHCMLMYPWINGALRSLQGRVGETTQVAIRYGVNTGRYLVQPTLKNEAVSLETGQSHYAERMLGREFSIASPSFFQVNTHQAERMAELVREALQLTGDEVLVDAYAGVGCFAALLAPHVREAIAIEESAQAVKDGRGNAAGLDNIRFVQGKTEEVLGDMDPPDAVILDPPRTGCREDVLVALCDLAPSRVVYVSCDPNTLARDLKVLVGGPFVIDSAQPVDMFPQTYHVECVVALSLREAARSTARIALASRSPRRRQILKDLGIRFAIVDPAIDEESISGDTPEQAATARALAKAEAAAAQECDAVIGADTVVVDGEEVLGEAAQPLRGGGDAAPPQGQDARGRHRRGGGWPGKRADCGALATKASWRCGTTPTLRFSGMLARAGRWARLGPMAFRILNSTPRKSWTVAISTSWDFRRVRSWSF